MGINNVIPKNLWKDKDSKNLSFSDKLVYRSRLLGADLQVTNFGGGNTSSKFFKSERHSIYNEITFASLESSDKKSSILLMASSKLLFSIRYLISS